MITGKSIVESSQYRRCTRQVSIFFSLNIWIRPDFRFPRMFIVQLPKKSTSITKIILLKYISYFYLLNWAIRWATVVSSVPDPNPDPRDPRVFGLPDPDPLVRGMDPDPALDPDPSIIMQK
jgi:hypothetical protein